jgi:hypothetical protein
MPPHSDHDYRTVHVLCVEHQPALVPQHISNVKARAQAADGMKQLAGESEHE